MHLGIGILFAPIAAFAVLILTVRIFRRMRPRFDPPKPAFDPWELSEMLQRGQITQAEFELMRESMARRQAAAGDQPPQGKRGFDVLPPK